MGRSPRLRLDSRATFVTGLSLGSYCQGQGKWGTAHRPHSILSHPRLSAYLSHLQTGPGGGTHGQLPPPPQSCPFRIQEERRRRQRRAKLSELLALPAMGSRCT